MYSTFAIEITKNTLYFLQTVFLAILLWISPILVEPEGLAPGIDKPLWFCRCFCDTAPLDQSKYSTFLQQ